MTCRRCNGTGFEASYRGKLLGCTIEHAAQVMDAIARGDYADIMMACPDQNAARQLGRDAVLRGHPGHSGGLSYVVCSDCGGLRVVQSNAIDPACDAASS